MGLCDLLPKDKQRLRKLPVELIDPNPAQPRQSFDENLIAQLACSIKENGLICPIMVRSCGARYQLIAGERRLRAFKMLEYETIPAIIEPASEQQGRALAIIENLQRRDLDFLEEAKAIEAMIEAQRLTQQQAAQKLGLSQSAVANKLRVLKLPQCEIERLSMSGFGERHARALLPLCQSAALSEAVSRIIKDNLTVSQTEKLVEKYFAPKRRVIQEGKRKLILKDLRLFTGAIEQAVDVMKQAGIEAITGKNENDDCITYTITIPKRALCKSASRS